MILILLSALITCIASLSLGQAALRICGASRWSWMAPPVGIAILMLLALPARYVPGRATTTALAIAILTVASFVWCARASGHRPPLIGLGVAAPVALLALVPFIAAGRPGTLGVGFSNDMTSHMRWVEAYMSQAVTQVTPLPVGYPLGPHAVVAALSAGLGSRVDMAFAGFTFALPVLTAWTALHALRRPTWLGQLLVATVVGMPYLVAAYYGEGAFKEVLQAQFVLALALWLEHPVPAAGRWRWAPLALLVAGTVSIYSVPGLAWPAAFLGLWLVARAAVRIYHADVHILAAELRSQLSGVAVAVGVLLVVLMPELPQLKNFSSLTISKSNLGNLLGPVPGWEAFGVWNNPDFRVEASPAFAGGAWTAFVLVLVIYGVVWSIRRGRWMLPTAAGASSLIWAYSAHSQSPYVTAKALVILSPLLLAVAAVPLAERPQRMSARWWAITPILALVLWARVSDSDLQALRISAVGPTNHLVELRALRGELHGEPTLFLGNDDFIGWELAGVPVTAPYIGFQLLPIPPQKKWSYGMALDIDSVNAATINANDWVITTRDAAQSALPPQLHLIRTTSDFKLWRRTGVVAPRQILGEGQNPGATLDCTPSVRTLIRNGGKAGVRKPPVSFPVSGIPPGGTSTVRLSLSPGAWDLETPYQSSRPVTVSGPGGVLRRLPANLDRPGPRWPIGRVVVPPSGSVTLTIHATAAWLTPVRDAANMVAIVATPVGTERVVPLRAACGRYVDWYTTHNAGTPPGPTDYPSVVLSDNPTAYWRLDEASGTSAADASGNANTGIYENGPTLGAPGLIGGGDTAVSFDGIDHRLVVLDSASLSPTSAVTAEAWVNGSSFASSSGGYRTVVLKGNSYWLRVDNVGGVQRASFFIHDGSSYYGVTSTGVALTTGATYYLVGTFDGSTLRIYVNGVEQDSAVHGGAVDDSTVQLQISLSSRSGWHGRLDEIAIYPNALTPYQVQQHYSRGLSE
jgi:hypothetical protein